MGFASSLKRPQMISYFQSNVSSGMHTVSFHNGNASLVGNGTAESSLLSASSFGLAAARSSEHYSFCQGLLSSLKDQLDNLYKNATMDAHRANFMLAAFGNSIMKDDSGQLAQQIMNRTNKSQDELKKYEEEISNQVDSLEKFTSDADIRFKGLKEAAEQKEFIAKSKYFTFASKNMNGTNTSGSASLEPESKKNDDDKKNADKSNNSSTTAASGSSSTPQVGIKLAAMA